MLWYSLRQLLTRIEITNTIINVPINYLKVDDKNIFDSIIMSRFEETKAAKEKNYAAEKLINIWDVNVDNLIISKLGETKTNSKYLTGYLDNVIY